MDYRDRSHPIHLRSVEKFNRSTIVFVTVCAEKRKRILANDQAAQTVIRAWNEADKWVVGRYVIMPDHIHFFCTPRGDSTASLASWMQFWRSRASSAWPFPDQQPIWQRDYWDRQMRTGESYESKWHYVRNNPVRHGLVAKAEDWQYAGKIHTLEWLDLS